ncbi:MAG TPA: hypothetical protein PKJ08_09290 [Candidatus Cloacimonadota bacterium]|nr:hypothetical protein [Candidatus Cloacimonadota bacterium]
MIKQYLKNLSLFWKVSFLIVVSFMLFPYMSSESLIPAYSLFLIAITFILAFLYYRLSSWRSLVIVMKLWLIGLVFYALFSLVFILNDWNISPTIQITETKNQVLYLLIYPVRVLAVFFTGLSFIEVISPVEFLKYGRLGYHLCYLLRSFQVSKEQMIQNKRAMEMMGVIPDTFTKAGDYKQFIRKSPLIIALTIRNLMIWLFWSSHIFEKFKNKQKESSKK